MKRLPITPLVVAMAGLLSGGLPAIQIEELEDGLHLNMVGGGWEGIPREEVVSILMNNVDLTNDDVSKIAAMPKLSDLRIGMNPEKVVLQCDNVEELAKLKQLKSLWICVSNPRKLPLSFVGEFQELESFSFIGDESAKDGFDLAVPISKMRKLRELELMCRGIDDAHVALITGACDLTSVTVHSEGITDEAVRSLRSEAELKRIKVDSPQLTDEAGSILGSSESLESLSISSPRLTLDFIKRIEGLDNLKELSVSVGEGSREVFEALRKLEKLESLEVVCATGENFDLSAIAGHRNLRRFFVRDVQASEESKVIVSSLPQIDYSQIGDWDFDKQR